MKKILLCLIILSGIGLFATEKIKKTEYSNVSFKGSFDLAKSEDENFDKLVVVQNIETDVYQFLLGYYNEGSFITLKELFPFDATSAIRGLKVPGEYKNAELLQEMGFYSIKYLTQIIDDNSYKLLVIEKKSIMNPESDFPDPTGEIMTTEREYIFSR